MRVLLIEDDYMIGEAMQLAMQAVRFAVDWVRDGERALQATLQNYDFVLLDLGLPRCDGMTVLQALRKRANPVPVLIVTARDGIDDRIAGLDLGADDYIVKPFDMSELMARMRSILRRYRIHSDRAVGTDVIQLNLDTHQMRVGDDEEQLSHREFALMEALLAKPGAILSREILEARIYGQEEKVASNAVEFLIYSIRRKFDQTIIRNVRGMGWAVAK
jgi:two-component system OmpR family response regulator